MKWRHAIGLALLVIFGAALAWLWPRRPRIPLLLAGSIPRECEQVVLVLSPFADSVRARLWLMEREGEIWKPVLGPLPVTLGHKGLAWGKGEHQTEMPLGFREKMEGDQCSPAGVFAIPFAFGAAPSGEAGWLRLPYTVLTSTMVGVDDPKSAHYNQVVDAASIERDWDSDETMLRHDGLYEWGAFIGHNPGRIPGAGSCIFLHRWPGPELGTAGCTAMSEEDLRMVLAWLDAAKRARLVQGLEAW